LDPRLLKYYNRELQHVREMGAEFAREYPKIAARLGMDGIDCADPYVERLLEGFAYLTARVQLKIDAEFPNFIQNLLQIVYPHYLAPTPSMTVVQFQRPKNRTLRPEMTTTVRVALATRSNVLAVPIRAVHWQGTRAYVLVPTPSDKSAASGRRWVTPGLKDESYWEILNGLAEGDEVLVGDTNARTEGKS